MVSRNDPQLPITIFSILSLALGFCCIALCCGSYILSKKKNKKQTQIHLSDDRRPSEAPTDVFTIDLPDAHLPGVTNVNPAYISSSDDPSESHQPIGEPLPS